MNLGRKKKKSALWSAEGRNKKTNHWIREAWVLQSAESEPWLIPSREVMVATFERIFPNAAKKASRFMGRWNDVDEQKVMMMKLAPISENTDDTREVIRRISSSRVVQTIFEIYIYKCRLGFGPWNMVGLYSRKVLWNLIEDV